MEMNSGFLLGHYMWGQGGRNGSPHLSDMFQMVLHGAGFIALSASHASVCQHGIWWYKGRYEWEEGFHIGTQIHTSVSEIL